MAIPENSHSFPKEMKMIINTHQNDPCAGQHFNEQMNTYMGGIKCLIIPLIENKINWSQLTKVLSICFRYCRGRQGFWCTDGKCEGECGDATLHLSSRTLQAPGCPNRGAEPCFLAQGLGRLSHRGSSWMIRVTGLGQNLRKADFGTTGLKPAVF